MALIDNIEVTPADRRRWPYMADDDGRRALKHVEAQSDARLLSCVEFDRQGDFDHNTPAFQAFLLEFGKINPNWVSAQIAEQLHARDLIDDDKLQRIVDY